MLGFQFGENSITTKFHCTLDETDDPGEGSLVRMEWLANKYEVAPHTDPTFPKWCYFLIVHNPGFYIGTVHRWRTCRMIDQSPGTVLGLDLHQLHWLAATAMSPLPDPTWIAMTFASGKRLRSSVVIERFRKAAKPLGELEAVRPGPLKNCAAARSDGECIHKHCPQNRDGEPAASGRSCPLPWWDDGTC